MLSLPGLLSAQGVQSNNVGKDVASESRSRLKAFLGLHSLHGRALHRPPKQPGHDFNDLQSKGAAGQITKVYRATRTA